MPILLKGTDFTTGDQVTAANLDNLVDAATFASGAVDNSTTQLSGGAIIVKDLGISTAKLADDAVTDAKVGTLSAVDIDGGTIDGTPIGGTTPAAGSFTTIAASGAITATGALTAGGGFATDANGVVKSGGGSRVTSDFSKTADTALASVTGLSATFLAATTYGFEAVLYVTCAAAGGFKVDLGGGSATVTSMIADFLSIDNATVRSQVQTTDLTTLGYNTAGSATTPVKLVISGTITVNGAGTFIPRFAQSSSNATPSVVLRGSRMSVWTIA
jgi:hypothetical protein